MKKKPVKRIFDIHIDGASFGNPGPSGIGVVIKQDGVTIKTISQYLGPGTNNTAEYMAFIYGLQECCVLKADQVRFFTDSELLANQVLGIYKVKDPNLKNLFDQAKHLASAFEHLEIKHVPREQNKEADHLAKESIKKEQAKVVASGFKLGEESPSSVG